MNPPARSASIAICFPGMASRANLAATSLMRAAPRVTTRNCMTAIRTNRITPTARELEVTKSLNAQTTCPAAYRAEAASAPSAPAVRISRVVATLSTSRSTVAS